jgi:hypothetical protein
VTSIAPVDRVRVLSNATILADGRVVVTGGGRDFFSAVDGALRPALWDPVSGEWAYGPGARRVRVYHSTALLLPDGRVRVAGSGAQPAPPNEQNAEIYLPPYLFKADGSLAERPLITSAPTVLTPGQPFTLQVDKPVSRLARLKTGAASHGVRFDQRFTAPPFVRDPATGTLTAYLPCRAADLRPDLSIEPVSGVISGILTRAGLYDPVIAVTDGSWVTSIRLRWRVTGSNVVPLTLAPLVGPGPQPQADSLSLNLVPSGTHVRFRVNWGDGSATTAWSPNTSWSYRHTLAGMYFITVSATDESVATVSRSLLQQVHLPVTAAAARASTSVLWQSATAGPRVWVLNPDNHSVSVLDAQAHTRLAELPTGASPCSLALTAGGEVWVTNREAASLSVYNARTLALVHTIMLPAARHRGLGAAEPGLCGAGSHGPGAAPGHRLGGRHRHGLGGPATAASGLVGRRCPAVGVAFHHPALARGAGREHHTGDGGRRSHRAADWPPEPVGHDPPAPQRCTGCGEQRPGHSEPPGCDGHLARWHAGLPAVQAGQRQARPAPRCACTSTACA